MINYRPLSKQLDGMKAYLAPEKPLEFASNMDFIPVASGEVYRFVGWYPVVIKENEKGSLQWGMPVKTDQFANCLVNPEKGRWMGQQLPTYIGRYPFALVSPVDKPETLVFSIDDNAYAFQDVTHSELQHKRVIFNEQGELSEHGQKTKQGLKQYEIRLRKDRQALQLLKEWDILVPWKPDFNNFPKAKANNFSMPLDGLLMVAESKLHQLSAEQVQRLFELDALKMIYAHRVSLLRTGAIANYENQLKSRTTQQSPMDDDIVTKMFDDDDEFEFNFDNI